MEHILFIWDSDPKPYITVCLESLRLYNKDCNIHFYYAKESTKKRYEQFNINFIKIDADMIKNKFQYYKISISRDLCQSLPDDSKVLILDCDLLFQNDPFLMFDQYDKSDIYYTHTILSTPDSLRPDKIWKSVKYKVNGGVWGFMVNEKSKKLLNFWMDNMIKNSWDKWKDFEPHIKNGINNLNWGIDQDFLNCLDVHFDDLPEKYKCKRAIVSYKYNYYTSTWGFFNDDLEMSKKIGNSDFVIIHFKANFKDTYNLENKDIYNIKNILSNKKLITDKSYQNIYKKFLSRGDRRFDIV